MGSPGSAPRASRASFGEELAGRWPDLDPAGGALQWLSRALAPTLHSFVLFLRPWRQIPWPRGREGGGERCLGLKDIYTGLDRGPGRCALEGTAGLPRAGRRRECDLSSGRAPSRPLPLRAGVSRTAWRSVSCAQLWNAFGRLTSCEGQHPGERRGRGGLARPPPAGFLRSPEDLSHPASRCGKGTFRADLPRTCICMRGLFLRPPRPCRFQGA